MKRRDTSHYPWLLLTKITQYHRASISNLYSLILSHWRQKRELEVAIADNSSCSESAQKLWYWSQKIPATDINSEISKSLSFKQFIPFSSLWDFLLPQKWPNHKCSSHLVLDGENHQSSPRFWKIFLFFVCFVHFIGPQSRILKRSLHKTSPTTHLWTRVCRSRTLTPWSCKTWQTKNKKAKLAA